MDFLAERPGDPPLLIQVCLDASEPATRDREVGALEAAARAFPSARALVVTLCASPPAPGLSRGTEWWPAARWLLDSEGWIGADRAG